MKKMVACLFTVFVFAGFAGNADAWTVLGSDIAQYWGNPPVITSAWNQKPITDVYLKEKKKPVNATDEAVAIVFMARILVAKGGHFCATQLRSRNSGKPTKDVWTQYQEVVGGPGCFWLCAPGYSGENCNAVSGDNNECQKDDISKTNLSTAGYRESGGWDDDSIEAKMDGKAYLGFGIGGTKTDEADTIVIARSWLPNNRGIVAKPVTFSAFCGWNDKSCKGGNSDLIIVESGGSEKTLCMPGWSGDGCTAVSAACKVCVAGAKWNESKQICVCANENTAGNVCKVCDNAIGEYLSISKQECMTCSKYQYWSDTANDCINKKKFQQSDLSKSACLGKFNNEDYRKCLDAMATAQ